MIRDQCKAFCQCSYCHNRTNATCNHADRSTLLLRGEGTGCSKDALYLRTLNESLRARSLLASTRNAHKFQPDEMLQSTRGDFARTAALVPVRRRDRLQELLLLEHKERTRAQQQRRLARRAAGLPEETDDLPPLWADKATNTTPHPETAAEGEEEGETDTEAKRTPPRTGMTFPPVPRLGAYNAHPYGGGVVWIPLDETTMSANDTAGLRYPGSTYNAHVGGNGRKGTPVCGSCGAKLRVHRTPNNGTPTADAAHEAAFQERAVNELSVNGRAVNERAVNERAADETAAVPAAAKETKGTVSKEDMLPYRSSAALWRTTNQDRALQMERFLEFQKMQKNAENVFAQTVLKRNNAGETSNV